MTELEQQGVHGMITLAQAFDKALASPKNRYAIVDGYHEKSDEQRHNVNWNFVDADCLNAMPTNSISDWSAYYEEFDALCDAYEKKYDEVFAS